MNQELHQFDGIYHDMYLRDQHGELVTNYKGGRIIAIGEAEKYNLYVVSNKRQDQLPSNHDILHGKAFYANFNNE